MKKFWAIICTVSFSLFWVFAGLSLLALIDSSPLLVWVLGLSLAGLAVGLWSRWRLLGLTGDLSRGERVFQREA